MGSKNRARLSSASRPSPRLRKSQASVKLANKRTNAVKRRANVEVKQEKQQRKVKREERTREARLPVLADGNDWVSDADRVRKQQEASRLLRKRKYAETGTTDEADKSEQEHEHAQPRPQSHARADDDDAMVSDGDQATDTAPSSPPERGVNVTSVTLASPSISTSAALLARRLRLKLELSSLADSLLASANPKLSLLHRVHELALDTDAVVARLALVTEASVLCDLIPAYRIRAHTEAELQQARRAAETRQVWEREQTLLQAYHRAITHAIKKCKVRGAPDLAAVKALCLFLVKAFHFNYRADVAAACAHIANTDDRAARREAFNAIVQLFRLDTAGDAALDTVTAIAKIVNRRGFAVHPELLECLTHIRFDHYLFDRKASDSEKDTKGSKPMSARKRKVAALVDESALARDLAEGEARVSDDQRRKHQTGMLTQIFTVYFTLIKSEARATRQQAAILHHILTGIQQYSLLINADLLLDLCALLKRLIDPHREPPLPFACCLRAASSLLAVLRAGHGAAIELDLNDLFGHIYAALWSLCERSQDQRQRVSLTLQTLAQLFQSRKSLAPLRAAAFVQRLCLVSLHADPVDACGLLEAAAAIARDFPGCVSMFDGDEAGVGSFDAETDEPDAANATASQCFASAIALWSADPNTVMAAQQVIAADQPAGTGAPLEHHAQLSQQQRFALPAPGTLERKARHARRSDPGHRALLTAARERTHPSDFLNQLLREQGRV